MRKHVEADMLARWVELYEAGVSARRISETCNFSTQTICSRLKEAGVAVSASKSLSGSLKGRPSPKKGSKLSADTCARMSEARKGVPGKKGYKFTDEQKAKMRSSRIAYIKSNPTKFKRDQSKASAARRVLSEEERNARDKARRSMKSMVRRILTMSRVRKDCRSEEILGYTQEQLREHIESKFLEGMSWHNRSSFHIDHIVPVAWFFSQEIYDPKVICALENLQPLYPNDNRRKSDRLDHESSRHMSGQYLKARHTGGKAVFTQL